MDKNKQLTLLSQCKLAFTGRNVLMALKKIIKKNQGRRLIWPRYIHFCHQKPNPARETVPLNKSFFLCLHIHANEGTQKRHCEYHFIHKLFKEKYVEAMRIFLCTGL
jgi:hypothetical protein